MNNFNLLLQSLANAHNDNYDVAPSLLATTAFKFLQDLPTTLRKDTDKARVYHALKLRYSKQSLPIPPAIRSVMALIDLLETGHDLAKDIQSRGPQVTTSVDNLKDLFSQSDLTEKQVAGALLFMVLTPDWQQYSPNLFVSTVQDVKEFEWQSAVREFDRPGLSLSPDQFLVIFNALLPVAQNNARFDIQGLWGGKWQHPATQLSFIVAFTSLRPSELDADTIPGLRRAYDPAESLDGIEHLAQYSEEARKDPMISLDAVTAIVDLMSTADDQSEAFLALKDIIGTKMGFFLCSAAGISRPWTSFQQSVMSNLLGYYLLKERPDYKYVLHTVWKQDRQLVATGIMESHAEDPMRLPLLLEHAQEHGWLADLCTILNGFGIDLAALAHRYSYINLEHWVQEKLDQSPKELTHNVHKFLLIKVQDELRVGRNEQPGPRTVMLSVKTVFVLLDFLEQHLPEDLVSLERQCVQAFPRLINYGEGFDEMIDKLGAESNSLSAVTDAQMQDIYKRMYSGELNCRDIIAELEGYKVSDEGQKQDLYACMIHGLFDEFGCFKEYPLAPLATTAVLFGGIISFRLVSDLTLRVGLGMILEAVRDWPPESSMYKFGLQALLQLQDRLSEWPGYCAQLVQIPGLRGTDPYSKATEVYASTTESNGDLPDDLRLSNGNIDDFLSPEVVQFRSIHAEPTVPSDLYEDPDEEIQEKVVFFFNNVSEKNLGTKLQQLQDVLEEKHNQWFAYFLVEERARVEPNYQQLYLDLLKLLGNKNLWNEVLRETYVSIQRVINAESTMKSAAERKNLKNLSSWLGSLTIARDKPIKQKNVSFKDLLIEGFDTQRLLIVIPFTCNVLIQAAKSVVFKPPNPWTVEIIRVLCELYHHVDIKLNQKFEIEVLCKELNITPDTYEVSTDIRTRPRQDEDLVTMMPDGIDGFEDLTLGSMNRNVRNARFSPTLIASSIPDLESLLVFPPSSGSVANQARLRQIVQNAVQRAILEIIAPVVERSVTIATIATTNLIHKDFARESDEDRVRKSAQQMVRQLSGSLALVTCKEPLRMSMTNYIRMAQAELPDQAFAEGAILMCVNDNLDTACSIVEKQAEDRSMPEIESHIENEIAQRRQYTAEHPNESYIDPAYNRWAGCIPEPYKLSAGGLNQEQMAIYLDFARQSRGPSHAQTSSADTGRQLPDVLQEVFAPISNIPTPSEAPFQTGRMLPPPLPLPQNGYLDPRSIQERIQDLVSDLGRLCKERSERYLKDFDQESPIVDTINQIWDLAVSSPSNVDTLALTCAHTICVSLHGDLSPLGVDVLVQLLQRLCQLSLSTNKDVVIWFANQDDEKVANVPVTVSLLEAGLMELRQVDVTLTRIIEDRKEIAIDFMFEIMNALLLNSHPIALRADFATSLGAMGQWFAEEPSLIRAKELMQRLRDWGVDPGETRPDERSIIRQHQLQYIFAEWITICNQPVQGKMFGAFISQLHQKQLLNSQEEMANFLRLCIDTSIETFDREEMSANGSRNEAYFAIDCLAKLIVLLVRNQGESDGAVKSNKPAYMDSMLSLITLVLNSHHVMRGERFNQKVFFRLYSSILCEWYDLGREGHAQDRDMMLVFADNLLALEPRYFPGFICSWLILVSHRIFMPGMLKLSDDEVSYLLLSKAKAKLMFRDGNLLPKSWLLPYPTSVNC